MSVFAVPQYAPFFPTCAQHLLKAAESAFETADPFALSKTVVWVPSPRMAEALRDALLEAGGKGLLLPHIIPIGVLPPFLETLSETVPQENVSDFARLMLFVKAVQDLEPEAPFQKTLGIAKSLADIWQRLVSQGVPLEKVHTLVRPEWQSHWQKHDDYLRLVSERYAALLAQENASDKKQQQTDNMARIAAYYRAQYPLEGAVYGLGFTDSTPAGRAVLHALAQHPQGALIVPLDRADKAQLSVDDLPATHPLYGLAHILAPLLEQTWQWLGEDKENACAGFTSLFAEQPTLQASTQHLRLLEAEGIDEEALAISHAMLEMAAQPGKTCALMTPDRSLTEMVRLLLSYQGVAVDSSMSQNLLQTAFGQKAARLLKLITEAWKAPVLADVLLDEGFFFALATQDKYKGADVWDQFLLRGLAPLQEGLLGWQKRLKEKAYEKHALEEEALGAAQGLLSAVEKALAPLLEKGEDTLSGWLRRHRDATVNALLDATCFQDEGEQDDAEAAAVAQAQKQKTLERYRPALEAWAQLIEDAKRLQGLLTCAAYGERLRVLFESASVSEATENAHPRLKILGALEGRLQRFDRVIIAGLNEGVLPPAPSFDPWLSAAQMKALALPDATHVVGLSAQDLLCQLASDDVLLTRRLNDGDGPTLPSRFWLRLQAAVTPATWQKMQARSVLYRKAQRPHQSLKTPVPDAHIVVTKTEALTPAVWSPSYVKNLMQCPFKAYVQRALRVEAREPYAQAPNARLFGDLTHDVLEKFFLSSDPTMPAFQASPQAVLQAVAADKEAAHAHLMQLAETAYACVPQRGTRAIWLARFKKLAQVMVALWVEMVQQGESILAWEQTLHTDQAPVPLKSTLDRVDSTGQGLRIIDYKTGRCPDRKDVKSGKEPQLALEALVYEAHGQQEVQALEWWLLPASARTMTVKEMRVSATKNPEDIALLTQAARVGLQRLKDIYLHEGATWRAVAGGKSASKLEGACSYCEFSGICRVRQWVGREGASA